jgi:hypothetical protein
MKARILKQHGVLQPGQILTVADDTAYPAGVAEYFENDEDPAIVTVREPSGTVAHNVVNDGEVAPLKGSEYAKAQAAKVKAVEAEHEAQIKAQTSKPEPAPKAAAKK